MQLFLKFYLPIYLVVFFFILILVPSYAMYKKTGVNPFVMDRKPNSAHDYIGFLFKLIFVTITIYVLINSFTTLNKIAYINTMVFQLISVILSILSIIFIVLSQKSMADSWRIGIDEEEQTNLVTTGVFAFVRNPIFLGLLLVIFSLFLAIPTGFMAYIFILNCILINIQVRLEEEFLANVHGEEYLHYKASVGRFLPKRKYSSFHQA